MNYKIPPLDQEKCLFCLFFNGTEDRSAVDTNQPTSIETSTDTPVYIWLNNTLQQNFVGQDFPVVQTGLKFRTYRGNCGKPEQKGSNTFEGITRTEEYRALRKYKGFSL